MKLVRESLNEERFVWSDTAGRYIDNGADWQDKIPKESIVKGTTSLAHRFSVLADYNSYAGSPNAWKRLMEKFGFEYDPDYPADPLYTKEFKEMSDEMQEQLSDALDRMASQIHNAQIKYAYYN